MPASWKTSKTKVIFKGKLLTVQGFSLISLTIEVFTKATDHIVY